MDPIKIRNSDRLDHFANGHPGFGNVLDINELSVDKLPTKLEVINIVRGLMQKHQDPKSGIVIRQHKIQVYKSVVEKLTKIWTTVFIPVPSFKYGWEMLEQFVVATIEDFRRHHSDRILESQESKDEFLKDLKTLYNFSKCKCYVNSKNEYKVKSFQELKPSNCNCKKAEKIPCLDFYGDQLFQRILTFDLIPVDEMAWLKQNYEGKCLVYFCLIFH